MSQASLRQGVDPGPLSDLCDCMHVTLGLAQSSGWLSVSGDLWDLVQRCSVVAGRGGKIAGAAAVPKTGTHQ